MPNDIDTLDLPADTLSELYDPESDPDNVLRRQLAFADAAGHSREARHLRESLRRHRAEHPIETSDPFVCGGDDKCGCPRRRP